MSRFSGSKRVLGAIVIGIVVFMAAYGSALALDVDAGSQGSEADVACQRAPVRVIWRTSFASGGTIRVAGVDIADVEASCAGQKVMVATYRTPTEMSGLFRATLIAGTTSVREMFDADRHEWTDPWSAGPDARDVNSVQVMFKGEWAPGDLDPDVHIE